MVIFYIGNRKVYTYLFTISEELVISLVGGEIGLGGFC